MEGEKRERKLEKKKKTTKRDEENFIHFHFYIN